MSNVVKFPHSVPRRKHKPLAFRSYAAIIKATEADLLRDAREDSHKAQVKLNHIKRQLQKVQERAAVQTQMLTVAGNKLSAALVEALLSEVHP